MGMDPILVGGKGEADLGKKTSRIPIPPPGRLGEREKTITSRGRNQLGKRNLINPI